jgi:hypothetical protein
VTRAPRTTGAPMTDLLLEGVPEANTGKTYSQ